MTTLPSEISIFSNTNVVYAYSYNFISKNNYSSSTGSFLYSSASVILELFLVCPPCKLLCRINRVELNYLLRIYGSGFSLRFASKLIRFERVQAKRSVRRYRALHKKWNLYIMHKQLTFFISWCAFALKVRHWKPVRT